jgi:hypothetical protein
MTKNQAAATVAMFCNVSFKGLGFRSRGRLSLASLNSVTRRPLDEYWARRL